MKEKINYFIHRYGIGKKEWIVLATFATLLLITGLFLALVIKVSVSKTSGHAFCSSCHSMKPFAKAYLDSPHGGNNRVGVRATCVECHLPHSGTISYLYVKAKLGIHDFLMETFTDTSKIDWKEISKRRESFVYDSGCLNCHKNLIEATSSSLKAVIAHKAYFNGEKEKCVSCHYTIGHRNLEDYLKSSSK